MHLIHEVLAEEFDMTLAEAAQFYREFNAENLEY